MKINHKNNGEISTSEHKTTNTPADIECKEGTGSARKRSNNEAALRRIRTKQERSEHKTGGPRTPGSRDNLPEEVVLAPPPGDCDSQHRERREANASDDGSGKGGGRRWRRFDAKPENPADDDAPPEPDDDNFDGPDDPCDGGDDLPGEEVIEDVDIPDEIVVRPYGYDTTHIKYLPLWGNYSIYGDEVVRNVRMLAFNDEPVGVGPYEGMVIVKHNPLPRYELSDQQLCDGYANSRKVIDLSSDLVKISVHPLACGRYHISKVGSFFPLRTSHVVVSGQGNTVLVVTGTDEGEIIFPFFDHHTVGQELAKILISKGLKMEHINRIRGLARTMITQAGGYPDGDLIGRVVNSAFDSLNVSSAMDLYKSTVQMQQLQDIAENGIEISWVPFYMIVVVFAVVVGIVRSLSAHDFDLVEHALLVCWKAVTGFFFPVNLYIYGSVIVFALVTFYVISAPPQRLKIRHFFGFIPWLFSRPNFAVNQVRNWRRRGYLPFDLFRLVKVQLSCIGKLPDTVDPQYHVDKPDTLKCFDCEYIYPLGCTIWGAAIVAPRQCEHNGYGAMAIRWLRPHAYDQTMMQVWLNESKDWICSMPTCDMVPSFVRWIQRYGGKRRRQLQKAWDELDGILDNTISAFIKCEIYVGKFVDSFKPRQICARADSLLVSVGPTFWMLGKFFKSVVFGRSTDLIYDSDLTATELGDIAVEMFDSGYVYEADVSNWDGSLNPMFFLFEHFLVKWFLPRNFNYFYEIMEEWDNLVGSITGLRFRGKCRRRSGDAWTSSFNSVINLSIVRFIVRPENLLKCVAKGDDNFFCTRYPLDLEYVRRVYECLGMKVVIHRRYTIHELTYCSGLFYELDDGRFKWGVQFPKIIAKFLMNFKGHAPELGPALIMGTVKSLQGIGSHVPLMSEFIENILKWGIKGKDLEFNPYKTRDYKIDKLSEKAIVEFCFSNGITREQYNSILEDLPTLPSHFPCAIDNQHLLHLFHNMIGEVQYQYENVVIGEKITNPLCEKVLKPTSNDNTLTPSYVFYIFAAAFIEECVKALMSHFTYGPGLIFGLVEVMLGGTILAPIAHSVFVYVNHEFGFIQAVMLHFIINLLIVKLLKIPPPFNMTNNNNNAKRRISSRATSTKSAKTSRPMDLFRTMGVEGLKYVLGAVDPTHPGVDGVKFPDNTAYPSVPIKSVDTFILTADANGNACAVVTPYARHAIVHPAAIAANGDLTWTGLTVTADGIYNSIVNDMIYYRPVSVGYELMYESKTDDSAGTVVLASTSVRLDLNSGVPYGGAYIPTNLDELENTPGAETHTLTGLGTRLVSIKHLDEQAATYLPGTWGYACDGAGNYGYSGLVGWTYSVVYARGMTPGTSLRLVRHAHYECVVNNNVNPYIRPTPAINNPSSREVAISVHSQSSTSKDGNYLETMAPTDTLARLGRSNGNAAAREHTTTQNTGGVGNFFSTAGRFIMPYLPDMIDIILGLMV